MKKRQKININPKKQKIQIKGSKVKGFSRFSTLFKENKLLSIGFAVLLVLFLILLISIPFQTDNKNLELQPAELEVGTNEVATPVDETLVLSEMLTRLKQQENYMQNMLVLDSNTQIENLLLQENLPNHVFKELVYLAKQKQIEKLLKNKSWYTIESSNEDQDLRKMFIYELSPSQYYWINALPEPEITLHTKAEHIKIKSIAGLIKTSVWNAILDNGGDYRAIEKMENALKWVVDFYHVQPNDRFKLIYEEKWVDGRIVDIGQLLAVSFQTNNKWHHAFYFEGKHIQGYFDKEGKSMKRKFLKSPVKYNRINSPYDPNRIHPVLGGVRPHYGTDFYAQKGDPIFAAASGVIIEARHKKNNGNYIKIKHDPIYQTQYLHMMEGGFAPGIKKGVSVKQGQVIGYAGDTGLASGVHVCYRFWKNGKQVDPLKEEVVIAETAFLMNRNAFIEKVDSLQRLLDETPFFDISF